MEQLQIQIARIIQNNDIKSDNNGILYGTTGMCIFLYHLSRQTNNHEFELLADDFLDKVFANLNTMAPADFENGLAGIGWGIEYLLQNNFAEGNADEILEEVDNKIFRVLNEDNHNSFELGNGLTGYLLYLINRLKNKSEPFSLTQRINRELLFLTINKIDELVIDQFPTIIKEMHFDLFWQFPVVLHCLAEAFKLHIYNEKINCMISQWIPYFEVYTPSLHINRLFLAFALKRINSLIPDKRLEKQAHILLFAIDFESIKQETDYNMVNIRFGWPGVLWLLNLASKEIPADWPNHRLIGQTYHEIKEMCKNLLANFPLNITGVDSTKLGLTLGLAGIGLMELLWPGVLSGSSMSKTP